MNPRAPGWRTGSLVQARALTASARSLTFEVPGWPGNAAGQHVDVRVTAPDGYQAVRSYSIATAGSGGRVELGVDRLPDGEVSPFLVDELEVGDSLELRGPLGGWFVWHPGEAAPVQLIAGGSGVVPLIAMARAHAAAGSSAVMRLLYSLRTPDDAFYRDELSEAGNSVETVWHYTRAVPPAWSRSAGRLTTDDLRSQSLPESLEPLIYLCGPTGFVEAVAVALGDLGHSPERIRTERFGGI